MKNNSNKSLKKRSKHTEKNFVFKKLNFEGESSNTQNPKKKETEDLLKNFIEEKEYFGWDKRKLYPYERQIMFLRINYCKAYSY
uniref:Uncharacterized protein n=1 Tax=Meloidogyne enterolobii TaxID=390850 RepID=A0A6V7V1U2_MELEN|nr:unnamed protein product [Meloidogyne enterolobii]